MPLLQFNNLSKHMKISVESFLIAKKVLHSNPDALYTLFTSPLKGTSTETKIFFSMFFMIFSTKIQENILPSSFSVLFF